MKVKNKLANLIGKKIYVFWIDDKLNNPWHWHDFYVGAIRGEEVLLFGTFDSGGNRHDGKPFWEPINNISKVIIPRRKKKA